MQLPRAVQTDMGKFNGSSMAWVPTLCGETAANKQQKAKVAKTTSFMVKELSDGTKRTI